MKKIKASSLFDKLIGLYMQYGFYKESLISITKKGMNGSKEIAEMMEGYRSAPPATINDLKVVEILDYQLQSGKNLGTGETWAIDLPKSNVLQFVLEDGSKISARPSGTEPKIKFYFSVNSTLENAAAFEETEARLDKKIEGIINSMKLN